jgi:hypothetical protein
MKRTTDELLGFRIEHSFDLRGNDHRLTMATDLIQVAALIESRRLVQDPSGVAVLLLAAAARKRRPAAPCQNPLHANKVIFVFNGGQHKKILDQRPDPVATLIRCERRISLAKCK